MSETLTSLQNLEILDASCQVRIFSSGLRPCSGFSQGCDDYIMSTEFHIPSVPLSFFVFFFYLLFLLWFAGIDIHKLPGS